MRSLRTVFCCVVVALALAAPALAEAQGKGKGRGPAGRSPTMTRGKGGLSPRGGRMGRGVGRMGGIGRRGTARRPAVDRNQGTATGSVRLKATPDTAMVYIDGALVGTAADFDGLTHHLQLGGGAHKIELRADGYASYAGEINVAAGKTTTERVTLKKAQ